MKRSADDAGLDEDDADKACPLCMDCWGSNNRLIWPCCCKEICAPCDKKLPSPKICPFCRTPVHKSKAEQLARYRRNAASGNRVAIRQLGRCFENGWYGEKKDSLVAASFYQQAVDLGDALAMHYLGICYANGNGVNLDKKKAVAYFRMAADRRDMYALNSLGCCLHMGEGVAMDDAEAVRFWKLAAELGYSVSEHNLGMMYANGFGVARDTTEAVRWYGRASKKGYKKAVENLVKLVPVIAAERDAAVAVCGALAAERDAALATLQGD